MDEENCGLSFLSIYLSVRVSINKLRVNNFSFIALPVNITGMNTSVYYYNFQFLSFLLLMSVKKVKISKLLTCVSLLIVAKPKMGCNKRKSPF